MQKNLKRSEHSFHIINQLFSKCVLLRRSMGSKKRVCAKEKIVVAHFINVHACEHIL